MTMTMTMTIFYSQETPIGVCER